MMLEGACVAYARAVQADDMVRSEGIIMQERIITRDGEQVVLKQKKHPAIEVSKAAWILVRSFCSEFGLSPVSRTRLAIGNENSGDDDLARLLAQPRERKAV